MEKYYTLCEYMLENVSSFLLVNILRVYILVTGTPEEVAKSQKGETARFIKSELEHYNSINKKKS